MGEGPFFSGRIAMPLPFLDWMPWWLQLVLLILGTLFAFVWLLMPFAVFGVKGRLDALALQIEDLQAELRVLAVPPEERRPLAAARAAAVAPMVSPVAGPGSEMANGAAPGGAGVAPPRAGDPVTASDAYVPRPERPVSPPPVQPPTAQPSEFPPYSVPPGGQPAYQPAPRPTRFAPPPDAVGPMRPPPPPPVEPPPVAAPRPSVRVPPEDGRPIPPQSKPPQSIPPQSPPPQPAPPQSMPWHERPAAPESPYPPYAPPPVGPARPLAEPRDPGRRHGYRARGNDEWDEPPPRSEPTLRWPPRT
ncbi:hypothetical protein [Nguyenibacter sp. L1]|nr:hypothetical protein [Nguyenibacter sp. L1]WRH87746.1 hypothetical protein QN315_17615 [Nguyenibacter sp. L1]